MYLNDLFFAKPVFFRIFQSIAYQKFRYLGMNFSYNILYPLVQADYSQVRTHVHEHERLLLAACYIRSLMPDLNNVPVQGCTF